MTGDMFFNILDGLVIGALVFAFLATLVCLIVIMIRLALM